MASRSPDKGGLPIHRLHEYISKYIFVTIHALHHIDWFLCCILHAGLPSLRRTCTTTRWRVVSLRRNCGVMTVWRLNMKTSARIPPSPAEMFLLLEMLPCHHMVCLNTAHAVDCNYLLWSCESVSQWSDVVQSTTSESLSTDFQFKSNSGHCSQWEC